MNLSNWKEGIVIYVVGWEDYKKFGVINVFLLIKYLGLGERGLQMERRYGCFEIQRLVRGGVFSKGRGVVSEVEDNQSVQ